MSYLTSLILFFSLPVFAIDMSYTTIKCSFKHEARNFIWHTNCKSNCKRAYEDGDMDVRVFVKDVKKPSEVEDYIVFEQTKSNKKYTMTYSLKCDDITRPQF